MKKMSIVACMSVSLYAAEHSETAEKKSNYTVVEADKETSSSKSDIVSFVHTEYNIKNEDRDEQNKNNSELTYWQRSMRFFYR
jgi:hypothetical protein